MIFAFQHSISLKVLKINRHTHRHTHTDTHTHTHTHTHTQSIGYDIRDYQRHVSKPQGEKPAAFLVLARERKKLIEGTTTEN